MFFPLRDDNPRSAFPALTLAIIAANGAVWAYELSLGQDFLQQFVLIAGAIRLADSRHTLVACSS